MSRAAASKVRPKYLSASALVFEIRFPLPAVVSILHRISGALLVMPFAAWLLYMLDVSLASEAGFEAIKGYLKLLLVKLGVLLFIWAYCHHFCAGIRFLVLDLNRGVELRPARVSSMAVLAVSLSLTAYFAWKLW